MKKTIVVVILATLTLAAFSMLSGPSVRADASEAQVLSYSWYVAPSNTYLAAQPGDLVAVGEIQNVGSNIIGNASVEGTAYDSSGNVLATVQGTVFVFHTLPEQKAPFYIDFTPASSSTADLSWVSSVSTVSVSISSVTDTSVPQYSDVTIPCGGSDHIMVNNDTYAVAGYINNTGTQTTGETWAVTTFYNAAGTVVGLNFTSYLTSSLAPAAMVPFWATPADNTAQLSSEIANYTVQIDSLTLTGTSSSTTTSSSPTASPTTSQLPIVPIVIGVVVVVVVFAVLMLVRNRQNLPSSLPPPPPPPPMP